MPAALRPGAAGRGPGRAHRRAHPVRQPEGGRRRPHRQRRRGRRSASTAPSIVVDFGTATTFDVVTAKGEYAGGVIVPGIGISLDALIARTAKLPRVELAWPPRVVGRTTVHAIQSGVTFGYTALVDGLVGRIRAENDPQARVLATGGLAQPDRSAFDHHRVRRRVPHPRRPPHHLRTQRRTRCQLRRSRDYETSPSSGRAAPARRASPTRCSSRRAPPPVSAASTTARRRSTPRPRSSSARARSRRRSITSPGSKHEVNLIDTPGYSAFLHDTRNCLVAATACRAGARPDGRRGEGRDREGVGLVPGAGPPGDRLRHPPRPRAGQHRERARGPEAARRQARPCSRSRSARRRSSTASSTCSPAARVRLPGRLGHDEGGGRARRARRRGGRGARAAGRGHRRGERRAPREATSTARSCRRTSSRRGCAKARGRESSCPSSAAPAPGASGSIRCSTRSSTCCRRPPTCRRGRATTRGPASASSAPPIPAAPFSAFVFKTIVDPFAGKLDGAPHRLRARARRPERASTRTARARSASATCCGSRARSRCRCRRRSRATSSRSPS